MKVLSSPSGSTVLSAVSRCLLICFVAAGLGLLVNALSSRGIPLFGPVPEGNSGGIAQVDLKQAWALHQAGKAVFVDARSPKEYRAGHIPRAFLLCQDTFEQAVPSWKNLVPLDTLVITYCSGEGCDSSKEVAALLIDEGYSRVKVFFGGWEQWKRAGYPVEKDSFGTTRPAELLRKPSERNVPQP